MNQTIRKVRQCCVMRRAAAGALVLGLAAGTTACGWTERLRGEAALVAKQVSNAREHGAYYCAPQELASTEINLEFADYELNEGDYFRAKRHVALASIAVRNVMDACASASCDAAKAQIDTDFDGVPDALDACPAVAGTDPHGCARPVLVVKTATQLELKQQILFEHDRDIITGDVSQWVLEQIAEVLTANAELKISIEGHADDAGTPEYNQRLSDGRAQSVRTALIGRGIDGSRLATVGFGESRPLTANTDAKARELNRRVEFKIVP